MPVYQVKNKESITHLFAGWEETLIWSCLEDCMGIAYADDLQSPQSAQILVADFCFFAGKANGELIRNRPDRASILVPQSRVWEETIEDAYGGQAVRRTRYATQKEPNTFDIPRLQRFAASLAPPYQLRMIDSALYRQVMATDWAVDLCGNFKSVEDFLENGLGVVALKNGDIVSGASSYTFYKGGIEIEIDTREDERRRGLALACGARLILECLGQNRYPSWDAHNPGSLALAEKLGYHFQGEYPVYELGAKTE